MSGWRNEAKEVAKDLPEDAERLGPAPRSPACTALTHSSHAAHRHQSAPRPTPVRTARDIDPSADRHPLYQGAAGQGAAAGGLRRVPFPSLGERGDLAELAVRPSLGEETNRIGRGRRQPWASTPLTLCVRAEQRFDRKSPAGRATSTRLAARPAGLLGLGHLRS